MAFNRVVVLRYRTYVETRQVASGTINLRLGSERGLAYEASDCGSLSGIGIVAPANAQAVYCHSARSVTAGSTRIPARAGMRIATRATSDRASGTAMYVNGSYTLT